MRVKKDGSDTQQTFLFLETILEETSDDLRSESDYSGPTGWPDSDSDTSSVIHIAEKLNATLRNTEWGGSERDLMVPKKRRRRQLLNSDPGVHDDEDNDNDSDPTVPMSRSSSLLQFETLERQCETVFKTSATSEPFAMATYNSNYHWRFSSSDSLDDNRSTSDSSDDALSRSYSSRSLKSNNSGLKSYRSFDSLTASQNSQADKNQGLLLSQSLSNNALYVEPETTEPIPTPRGIYKTVECLTEMSCQHSNKSEETVRPKRSVENLSEDSGFGDHTSTAFPNGEFSSFSLFSAETDKERVDSQGDIMNETEQDREEEVENEVNAAAAAAAAATTNTNTEVKIEEAEEEGEEDESKFSHSWQSAPDLHEEESDEEDCSENEIENEQCNTDHIPNMTSRIPIRSTPNLHHYDDEFLPSDHLYHTDSVSCLSKTYSLKRINFESESDIHASRTSVCSSKSNRVQITTSFVNLSSNALSNGGANHNNNNSKVHFSPVVSEVKWKDGMAIVHSDTLAKDYYSPSSVDAMVKKLFHCEEEEKEGHMDIKCVNVDANEENSVASRPSYNTMDSYQRNLEREENKSPKHLSKFGEFFQRFSFKRLSGRSNHSKRKDDKKNAVSKKPENNVNVSVPGETRNVEDTKIIPLHPASKPPLPPSSRRRPSPVYPQYQVSSSMSAECNDHDGILETDLDSEITTKKAQSLLNLDNDRKPKSKHPTSTLTPHTDYRAKSMEFLLDKENQEAVKNPTQLPY
ncbi:hypothetical protein M8J77_019639 [Diaphorina citri]|nr:hypothetical protein M8J77_019639 [Diaphorina citri]